MLGKYLISNTRNFLLSDSFSANVFLFEQTWSSHHIRICNFRWQRLLIWYEKPNLTLSHKKTEIGVNYSRTKLHLFGEFPRVSEIILFENTKFKHRPFQQERFRGKWVFETKITAASTHGTFNKVSKMLQIWNFLKTPSSWNSCNFCFGNFFPTTIFIWKGWHLNQQMWGEKISKTLWLVWYES